MWVIHLLEFGPDRVPPDGTTYSWKHRSTGEPAEVQMPHPWTFCDGKIISMQHHLETLKVQKLSA